MRVNLVYTHTANSTPYIYEPQLFRPAVSSEPKDSLERIANSIAQKALFIQLRPKIRCPSVLCLKVAYIACAEGINTCKVLPVAVFFYFILRTLCRLVLSDLSVFVTLRGAWFRASKFFPLFSQ